MFRFYIQKQTTNIKKKSLTLQNSRGSLSWPWSPTRRTRWRWRWVTSPSSRWRRTWRHSGSRCGASCTTPARRTPRIRCRCWRRSAWWPPATPRAASTWTTVSWKGLFQYFVLKLWKGFGSVKIVFSFLKRVKLG